MAQAVDPTTNYTHGYSNYTTATHQLRTAESDAAFLLPYIKKTDRILDVGCGPGTITTGLAKYASEGATIGIDISAEVLQKARDLAAEAGVPTSGSGPGSVVFAEANVVTGLPYPDDSFDVVFSSQVFGHLPLASGLPVRALVEIRRVLRPGGVVATRDAAASHFYPRSCDLDRLWVRNQGRVISKTSSAPDADTTADTTATSMPALFRRAGFDKVRVGAGAGVFAGAEARKMLAWRAAGQLKERGGDQFRQNWLDAGISEDEIRETLGVVEKWADTEDAWFATLQCEMLAWK